MKNAETKDRIKKALEIREMRQSELVERTGIDKGQMSSYLTGRYKPKQNNLHAIAEALSVDEAWLMGYDVPMERNDYEDQTLLLRDAELEEIELILKTDGYYLCCKNYDDDFFTVKNALGQTIASFSAYELISRYKSLKKKQKLTAALSISSESSFFKYLESLGYYIDKDDPEHKPFIHYGNGAVLISSDKLNDIRTRIDAYAKATLDSVILKLNEDELRQKRLEKEKTIKQLQGSQFEKGRNAAYLEPKAAHNRTDIEVTEEMQKHDDDIMDDDTFWNK